MKYLVLILTIGCSPMVKNHYTKEIIKEQYYHEKDFIEFVKPCEYAKEVLMFDGEKYYAYFKQGKKEYIALLELDTQYTTTDGTGCKFQITGAGIDEIN